MFLRKTSHSNYTQSTILNDEQQRYCKHFSKNVSEKKSHLQWKKSTILSEDNVGDIKNIVPEFLLMKTFH